MKLRMVLLFISIIVGLQGCGKGPGPIPLNQTTDQIEKIELLFNDLQDNDSSLEFSLISEIPSQQHGEFIDGLLTLDADKISFDPPTGFGEIVICITYFNGDMELIGESNNAYYTEIKKYSDSNKFRNVDSNDYEVAICVTYSDADTSFGGETDRIYYTCTEEYYDFYSFKSMDFRNFASQYINEEWRTILAERGSM